MKTSNKLLIGLFALIILSITIIIFMVTNQVKAIGFGNETFTKKGYATLNPQLKYFNKLEVSNKIKVQYTQGSIQKVSLKVDSSLLDDLEVKVVDSKLIINSNSHSFWKDLKIEVEITNDSLNEIDLSSGVVFKAMNELKIYKLSCDASAGAIIKANGTFNDLKLELSAGAIAELSGKCNFLYVEASAGAIVKANDLNTSNGKIDGSAGAIINISVSDNIDVDGSAGTIIHCKGSPKTNKMDISSGAQFSKD
jgi:hypothetical protein